MNEAGSDQIIPEPQSASEQSKENVPPSSSSVINQPKITKYIIITILLIIFLVSGGILVQSLFQPAHLKPPAGIPSVTPWERPTSIIASPAISATQAPVAKEVRQLATAHNFFGFNILKQLLVEDKNKNIFLSPASIALALSMTYNGAEKETKAVMAKTLQVENMTIDELNQASESLMTLIASPDPKVQISVANSIWARAGEEFRQEFLTANEKFYRAKITSLDFKLPSSADTINNWVSENTKGKIPTIIQPPIPAEMVMYLINAIYFKGTWTVEFDKKLTQEREFTSLNGTKSLRPMMKQTRKDFNYLETDDFQAVELPYGKNERLGMYVFLPKRDLADFFSKLTGENWNSWMDKFLKREGILVLPKFKIEYEKKLNDTLGQLGMAVAFGGGADFSKIGPGLFISEVIHKSYIEVNEEGTEAAAVTSVGVGKTAIGPDEKFYLEVNKPFFYAISDKQTGEVLFMGVAGEITGS